MPRPPRKPRTTSAAPASDDPVAAAQREAAEYKDKVLRTLAEMENLRRRTEREVADARVYGIAGFARDVLAVADNMHRALEAIGPELRETADAKVKALIEGVELTERELLKSLEKNGVKKFSPQGEKFDPNLHQAMYEMQDPKLPPGSVGAGDPGRLHDRRARAAPGAGRRGEGRAEGDGQSADRQQRGELNACSRMSGPMPITGTARNPRV